MTMQLMDGKDRAQIRVNLDQRLKDVLDKDMSAHHLKPGQLATMVFEWYLRQPDYLRALIRSGPDAIPPNLREQVAREAGHAIVGIAPARKTA